MFLSDLFDTFIRFGKQSRGKCGSVLAVAGVLLLAVMAVPHISSAQQFAVDDAEVVDPGACQLEAWYGEVESWIIPSCQFIHNLEVGMGLGFLDDDGDVIPELALEGKLQLRTPDLNTVGTGLVVGFGADPRRLVDPERIPVIYSYAPFTLPLLDENLTLHANLGWEFDVDAEEHLAFLGARADVALFDPLLVYGELFTVGPENPEYQLGLRITAIPDLLEFDITYGGHTDPDLYGFGLTVGVAWTPAPFFSTL